MPSDKEMLRWMVLAVVLVWGVLVGMIWDQILLARVSSMEDTLHHLQRSGPLIVGVGMGVVCFGALFLTRLVYCALRERRPERGTPYA